MREENRRQDDGAEKALRVCDESFLASCGLCQEARGPDDSEHHPQLLGRDRGCLLWQGMTPKYQISEIPPGAAASVGAGEDPVLQNDAAAFLFSILSRFEQGAFENAQSPEARDSARNCRLTADGVHQPAIARRQGLDLACSSI